MSKSPLTYMHQSQPTSHLLCINVTVHLELWSGNHLIWCNANFNGSRASVPLIYGGNWKKKTRRKKPFKGLRRLMGAKTGPRLRHPGRAERVLFLTVPHFCTPTAVKGTLPLTALVELPPEVVAPVEQVARNREATSPLDTGPTTRPTDPWSLPRWEIAHSRIKGRFNEYISPPPWNHRRPAVLACFASLAATPRGRGQDEHRVGGARQRRPWSSRTV